MEKALEALLKYYLSLDDDSLEAHLKMPNRGIKERVTTINDLKVIIYPNDHPPPHFHVKSNDMSIDAKFKIENCELIWGELNSKNRKRIKAFYSSPKGKLILEAVWKKYHG